MKNRGTYWRRYKIQETLYDNDASVPFKLGTLGPHAVLSPPSAAPSYFPESHLRSEISSLSKVILVLGKARSCRMPNLGCRGAESPGWFDILQKNSAWEVKHEQVHCHDEAANHHLPIAVAFWIIWIGYVEECWNLTQNLMQIRWSAPSVILNVMATQYICSLNGVYCPHWWVEWSHHCLYMCIPVHSPWLPGYINVVQTVLIIPTIVGHFLDKPHMHNS